MKQQLLNIYTCRAYLDQTKTMKLHNEYLMHNVVGVNVQDSTGSVPLLI